MSSSVAATSSLKADASHAGRIDSIQPTTFDRDMIADKALFDRTGEPFVKEYRLLPNYFESSRRKVEEVSADVNDDKRPIYLMREGAVFTVLDANLSPLYEISTRFPHPFLSNDDYYTSDDISDYYRFGSSSSSGLFCFQESRKNLIWNPATNEFKLLPEEDPHSPSLISSEIWFDPKSQDYKLMRLCVVDFNADTYEIELYYLKTDSWKKISCPTVIKYGWRQRLGVCINGVFYNDASTTGQVPVIFSFDFSTETTCILPLPPTIDKSLDLRVLDYNGLLSVLAQKSHETTKVYQLWVMRDGSWDLVSLYHACVATTHLWPISFSRNGELLFFTTSNRNGTRYDQQLLVFDSATGKLNRLDGRARTGDIDLEIMPFSESFVKLKGRLRINNDLEENEEDKLQQTNDI